MSEKHTDAVIVCPMDSECSYLVSCLSDIAEYRVGGYVFYEGVLFGKTAVVARCLIGTVNAAVCTYIAIERYSPEYVIVQGTAGAHDIMLNRNDIVIAEKTVSLGHIISSPKKSGQGTNPFEWEEKKSEAFFEGEGIKSVKSFLCDTSLVQLAQKVNYKAGKVFTGTVGCADIWNKEADLINFYRKTKNTLCEAMEGFAVSQVCAAFGVPMVEIRVISNNELQENKCFSVETAENCQKFVLEMIKLM